MTAATDQALQLWRLAQLMVQENQVHHAVLYLERCIASSLPDADARHARILLADCCLVLCQTEPREQNGDLWHTRYACAERLLHSDGQEEPSSSDRVDDAISPSIELDIAARRIKCNYLLAKLADVHDPAMKNRHVLEVLCTGLRWCSEKAHVVVSKDVSERVDKLRVYLVAEFRATLESMYVRTMKSSTADESQTALAALESNLKLVRGAMPNDVDAAFQLWLVVASCHVLVALPRFGTNEDAKKALEFTDRWFSANESPLPTLKVYHHVVKCLLLHNTGELKALGAMVDELNAVVRSSESTEPLMLCLIDALSLEVMSRHDPTQAITTSMKAIHQLQSNLPVYETRQDVYVLMLGMLFDMLFIHCDLHRQQARFFELGVSLSQVLKLFDVYKVVLVDYWMFGYYAAQIHVSIAKYAFAIANIEAGECHIRQVLAKHLAPHVPSDNFYPMCFARLWVSMLEATLQCPCDSTMVAAHTAVSDGCITQVFPTVAQLNLAAELLQTEHLSTAIEACGNVELKAKFQMLLSKWMWFTSEIGKRSLGNHLLRPAGLEQIRPDLLRMLHEALECIATTVNSTEATGECMAILGAYLIECDRLEAGEDTLRNAIRVSLHAKNVVLQTRVLAEVYRLYELRSHTEAQATTADKYGSKLGQLLRRVAQTQQHESNAAIFAWSSTDENAIPSSS